VPRIRKALALREKGIGKNVHAQVEKKEMHNYAKRQEVGVAERSGRNSTINCLWKKKAA